MVFVYLRDGQRLEVNEGITFAHRGSTLICLNGAGEEVKRFDARGVTAYGHIAYPYGPDFVSMPLAPEEAQPSGTHRRTRRSHSR